MNQFVLTFHLPRVHLNPLSVLLSLIDVWSIKTCIMLSLFIRNGQQIFSFSLPFHRFKNFKEHPYKIQSKLRLQQSKFKVLNVLLMHDYPILSEWMETQSCVWCNRDFTIPRHESNENIKNINRLSMWLSMTSW